MRENMKSWQEIKNELKEYKNFKYKEQGFHNFAEDSLYKLEDNLFSEIKNSRFKDGRSFKNKFEFDYISWDDDYGEWILYIKNGKLLGNVVEIKNINELIRLSINVQI